MMSKKKYERKLREEQEATAYVFQDFINTFQTFPTPIKTFVKSTTLYAENNQENGEVGQLYNPKPLIKQNDTSAVKNAIECARILKENTLEKSKKRQQEKPKSNLDLLKEELKMRHIERGEREKCKEELELTSPAISYFEGGDPNSTNLFVANLNSKITENHLMMEFGAYGPLASVKIMWPRGDERLRNSNYGFVAFMNRKDAERALHDSKHRDDMRVGWGKSVELPSHPIYVPNELLKLYLPPPPSGLPFNAQSRAQNYQEPHDEDELKKLLYNCVIKVAVPLNKMVSMLVHRMVEFVVREGPVFEAFIMNRELGNPEFNFLFDYQNPVHVYYRWKLYSILIGENKKTGWSMNPFRMYKGGSIWIPPTAPNYSEGMQEQLFKAGEKVANETILSESQCGRLIDVIRKLSGHRSKIAEAMAFCMNHSSSLKVCINIIAESMMNPDTHPLKKIARLYLLSDVLSNSKSFKIEDNNIELFDVFQAFQTTLNTMGTLTDKDNFKSRIMKILRHWEMTGIASTGFIKKAESLFVNCLETLENAEDDSSSTDEPLDGAYLLKRSLQNDIGPEVVTSASKKQRIDKKQMQQYFVPSKWDAVDPEEVEAQAMSSKKLYYMELDNQLNQVVGNQENKNLEQKMFLECAGQLQSKNKHKMKKEKEKEKARSARKSDTSGSRSRQNRVK